MNYKLYENLVTLILIAGIIFIVIGSIIILGSIIRDIKSSGSVVIFIGPVPVAISWESGDHLSYSSASLFLSPCSSLLT